MQDPGEPALETATYWTSSQTYKEARQITLSSWPI